MFDFKWRDNLRNTSSKVNVFLGFAQNGNSAGEGKGFGVELFRAFLGI